MQENQRNGQDDSDIVEISEPFAVTPAALNRRIISSADYHWLKQGPVNQSRGHLSASRSGPEGIVRNFLKSFRWARKCLLQTEENVARKKLLVVLWCSYGQYYRRKANTIGLLYRKIFTSGIDMQHVKLEFYKVHYFCRV